MSNNFIFIAVSVFTIFSAGCKKTNTDKQPLTNIRLDDGLIAYFPFNGNSNDESGNNNHGFFEGDATLTYDEHGKANQALNGNGNGSRMVVNNNGKITFDTAFSVSFHIMLRNFSRHHFVSMINNNTGSDLSFGIGTNITGSDKVNFGIPNSTVPCNSTVVSASQSSYLHAYTLQPESWYNIVCIFQKGTMKLYVNGDLVSSTSGNTQLMRVCQGAQLLIGGWWKGDAQGSLNGKIDEVRLYNRSLRTEEIDELAKDF